MCENENGSRAVCSRSRSVKVVEVVQVVTTKGNGTDEDPNRVITEYWSLDGELLAVVDPKYIYHL